MRTRGFNAKLGGLHCGYGPALVDSVGCMHAPPVDEGMSCGGITVFEHVVGRSWAECVAGGQGPHAPAAAPHRMAPLGRHALVLRAAAARASLEEDAFGGSAICNPGWHDAMGVERRLRAPALRATCACIRRAAGMLDRPPCKGRAPDPSASLHCRIGVGACCVAYDVLDAHPHDRAARHLVGLSFAAVVRAWHGGGDIRPFFAVNCLSTGQWSSKHPPVSAAHF